MIEDGARTLQEIKDMNGTAVFIKCDVSVADECKNLIDSTIKEFGSIHIVVNNAGIGGGKLRLHEIEQEEFNRVLHVNLGGCFLMSKYAIPYFLIQGFGNIINIASTYGLIGAPKATAYCASKG